MGVHTASRAGLTKRGRRGAETALQLVLLRAQRAVRADAGTRALLDRIPDWTAGATFGGHDSPKFAPNLVALLLDHGVEAADDPRIGRLLDRMLDHQDADGRLQSYASERSSEG